MFKKGDNEYRSETTRYVFHEYNGGEYFITICTQDKKHYFGHIQMDDKQNPTMCLSEVGLCVERQINYVNDNIKYVDIPVYVIMPNHIHLYVVINWDIDESERLEYISLKTGQAPSLQNMSSMERSAFCKGKLSVVIGSIKSAVTKYANENKIPFRWQLLFHDHIIRNQEERRKIIDYIQHNVANWGVDRYNDGTKQ